MVHVQVQAQFAYLQQLVLQFYMIEPNIAWTVTLHERTSIAGGRVGGNLYVSEQYIAGYQVK
ncbi:hypothetical protein KC878_03025, partial [Candidatus Saccharibacteria bacterium]|nr:hypothetical protein [Candidatus Saccharibacteria bacterium]